MKEFFTRFMAGRYGSDQLSRFLMGTGLVLLVLYMITKSQIVYLLLLAILIYNTYRIFSRNASARYAENMKYCELREKVIGFFTNRKKADPNHRIYSCPGCHQKVRVPKGRGKIEITCPKCSRTFIKKT